MRKLDRELRAYFDSMVSGMSRAERRRAYRHAHGFDSRRLQLKDSTGMEVELIAWQASAMAPAALGFVVVSAESEPGQLGCPCTLKLWEAQRPRTVTRGNVTFPPIEQGREQGKARE